ncbi:hypothetical protein [Nonomuraea jabiensis]
MGTDTGVIALPVAKLVGPYATVVGAEPVVLEWGREQGARHDFKSL